MQTPPSFHLWFPSLFDLKGGIETYSGFLLQALKDLYPGLRPDIFLMHDRGWKQPPTALSRFHFTGSYPARLRAPSFAAQAFAASIQHRPDLIISTHLHFTVAAYWFKQVLGIPYWVVAHGFESWDVQRPALRRAIAHADRILAVSRYTRDRLVQEHNLDPVKVSLLPNTFDVQRFQPASKPAHLLQKHDLMPDQPVILTVNRLAGGESYHPYDRVLEALPQIRQALPNVHYMIVGQGNDRPRLEALIAARQLQDCVTLAGFVPDDELVDYYNLCDVFAMPSKLEGFGIVFLEAMASGKPVLGSCRDGATEPIGQGRFGALVDPDDTDAISTTLIHILQGTYPNPLMYQPEQLRQVAIDQFGYEPFKHTLGHLLSTHFHQAPILPPLSRQRSLQQSASTI